MPEFKGNSEDEHLHLIIMSGINSEGLNVIFAVAIVQEISYETFCWVLFQFKQANASHFNYQIEEDESEPETIVTTFH